MTRGARKVDSLFRIREATNGVLNSVRGLGLELGEMNAVLKNARDEFSALNNDDKKPERES